MGLPQQPLVSPFDERATVDEVIRGIDLRRHNTIVTGASAGLGVDTARAFALAGARVVLAVRSTDKGCTVAAELRRATGNPAIEVEYLDLGIWSSVRDFATRFRARGLPLHILVNNAGLMPATRELIERQRADGGIEAQFGCNFLGHALLTRELLPVMPRGARVVMLSSAAHRRLPARFDDINFERHPYDKLEAYSISKSANSLLAVELTRRYEAQGITATAVNPGPVFTAIQNAFSPDEMKAMKFHEADGSPAAWFRPTAVGAATIVWCATSPLLAQGGVYCEDCNVAELRREAATTTGPAALKGVRPWAIDPELARALWDVTARLLDGGVVARPNADRRLQS